MKKLFIPIYIATLFISNIAYAQQKNPNSELFVDFSNRPGSNKFSSLGLWIIETMLGFIGLIAMVYLIYGGFMYLTSGSNGSQAVQGRKIITNAIIGLIIAILSYIIVTVVVNSLYS